MKVIFLILSFFSHHLLFSQTLATGDIAFIGYNTDGTDDFTFITLTDIPGSEVIYLTEEGWDNNTGTWVGTTETHLVYTAPPGGLPCGTVVHINETGSDVFTIGCSVSGATISVGSGSSYTLSGGDQILAYQATNPEPAGTPTFIAGVHGDDGNGTPLTLNATTGWNDLCCTPAGVARSEVPAGLTNGVNCVSLFPSIGTETDNAKYTGTLTGTSTALRSLINDRTNWSSDDITPFNITFGSFSPSVICLAPLSIELGQFMGQAFHASIGLKWSTNSEFNNAFFLIERSDSLMNWFEIARINGAGNSSEAIEYFHTDERPFEGVNYYRLKQIDFNGEFTYSTTIVVLYEENNPNELLIFPNPAINQFTITNFNSNDKVRILNTTGVEVTNQVVFFNNSNGNQIDISKLENGTYLIIQGNQVGKFYKLSK